MKTRSLTKEVRIKDVVIGKDHPIAIQSMTNTKTADVTGSVRQILELEEAGCEIIRMTVPDQESADALKEIKKQIHIPLVADIHFDYRMAIAAMENGADKIRVNPGNLGGRKNLKKVIDKAKEYEVPIRIGVNAGSLEKDLLATYGRTAEALCESALRNVRMVEEFDFDNIVVSIKHSDVVTCCDAYRMFSEACKYPLHIGVTEAGGGSEGLMKSAMGLGIMLYEGIGDTLRVSLTGSPVSEIDAAKKILSFMNIRRMGPEFVSCPTCGRTQIDLIKLAHQAKEELSDLKKPMKIAIMGCIVNGPGEALDADLGIAGGKGEGLLFKKGKILKKLPEDELLQALIDEARKEDAEYEDSL